MTTGKTLTFRSNDLGQNVYLILTFDKQPGVKLYEQAFPTSWKVIGFPARGHGIATVTYEPKLVVTKAQVDGAKVLPSAAYSDIIQSGQQTTLENLGTEDLPIYSFTKPVDIPTTTEIKAKNGAGMIMDFGIALEDGQRDPSTLLVWKDISENETLGVEFTPTLSAYTARQFKKNEIIKGQLGSDLNWSENLIQLRNETNWLLTRDKNNGKFSLIGDDAYHNRQAKMAAKL